MEVHAGVTRRALEEGVRRGFEAQQRVIQLRANLIIPLLHYQQKFVSWWVFHPS